MAEGGAFSFMASELLAPAKFGLEDLIPIQVADQMDSLCFRYLIQIILSSHGSAHLCEFS